MDLIGKQNEKNNNIWEALKKYGIYNEEELDEAIKNMRLLNIAGFVNKI